MTTSPQGTLLYGAVVVVTGDHRRFGRALVEECLARGTTEVAATSRSSEARL